MITDLTVGHPKHTLWRFLLPMFISVMFQQLYNIADSSIAGRFAGEDALAAVGASYPITVIFMAFAVGSNLGASVVVSRLFGARDIGKMKSAVYTAFIACGLMSLILTVLGYVYCGSMMRLIHTPSNIFGDGELYLKIYVFGLTFLFLYNVCTGIFTALGDSKTPLYFLIGSSIGNILLDYWFVAKFHWGVAGVAWATFIMGFSLLSMSEFFVFRKMETCETKNHPLCGCESRSYTKSPFRFIIEVSKPLSKKGKVIYMAKKANDLAHTKWMCKYHIVFTPKYRRKVIYNQYKEDLRDILKQLCSYKGVEILEGKLMPDHVHMLVAIPPKYSVSSFMGYLKGKSALMMFDRHANLKYKFGNRHFWSEGYYVSTVGLNEDTIRKYIKEQERYDQMVDKLSVKEYEDPFKG